LKIFWQEIINECKEKQVIPAVASNSPEDHPKKSEKNAELIKYCYNILHELKNKFKTNPLYRFIEKEIISSEIIQQPMDLSIINSKLKSDQYTEGILEGFEEDIRLIICNCYTYNEINSDMYYLGKELEATFNKIWIKVITYQAEKKEKLKRKRDNDADSSTGKLSNNF
jgi:hypothetical protein